MVNPLLITETTNETQQLIQPQLHGQTDPQSPTQANNVASIADNYEWKMIPIWVKQDKASTEIGNFKIHGGPDGGVAGKRKKLGGDLGNVVQADGLWNVDDIMRQNLMQQQPVESDWMRHQQISQTMHQKALSDDGFNDNINQQIN